MSDELKHCPFCGASGEQVEINEMPDERVGAVYSILCRKCMSEGPVRLLRESAIEFWNHRLECGDCARLMDENRELRYRVDYYCDSYNARRRLEDEFAEELGVEGLPLDEQLVGAMAEIRRLKNDKTGDSNE